MPGKTFEPDDVDDEELVTCNRCSNVLVYWGDHYDSAGMPSRRLFNLSNHRPHSCAPKLDANAFPEEA